MVPGQESHHFARLPSARRAASCRACWRSDADRICVEGLEAENHYELTGLEAHIAGLRYARLRLPSVEFVQADARNLPYKSTFDAVGAFDVIEHIVEDDAVLASVRRALKPDGIFIVTVPQHTWLWSPTDVQALHKAALHAAGIVGEASRRRF